MRRYWKSKYFKKTAEMALLCKYWDHQKNRHTQKLDHEAARAKELSTKAMAKSGADGKDYCLENAQCIYHSLVPSNLCQAKAMAPTTRSLRRSKRTRYSSKARPTIVWTAAVSMGILDGALHLLAACCRWTQCQSFS
eukprot:COSAG02_NODE_1133_length_14390_cov_3.493178_5_plen_137_part_00